MLPDPGLGTVEVLVEFEVEADVVGPPPVDVVVDTLVEVVDVVLVDVVELQPPVHSQSA
jgi:hypothetical protein